MRKDRRFGSGPKDVPVILNVRLGFWNVFLQSESNISGSDNKSQHGPTSHSNKWWTGCGHWRSEGGHCRSREAAILRRLESSCWCGGGCSIDPSVCLHLETAQKPVEGRTLVRPKLNLRPFMRRLNLWQGNLAARARTPGSGRHRAEAHH